MIRDQCKQYEVLSTQPIGVEICGFRRQRLKPRLITNYVAKKAIFDWKILVLVQNSVLNIGGMFGETIHFAEVHF